MPQRSFFAAGFQFRISVIGAAAASATGWLIRNRPSRATAYCGRFVATVPPPTMRDGLVASSLSTQRQEHVEYDHIVSHTRAIMADTARVTVTLAADLVDSIDRIERNRSRFIAEAVQHELARRRQAGLLQSIRSPHADTVALVDTGLADWVSDLPDEEGLVDVDAGTPVRWVEGQGWTKGRA